MCVDMWIFNFSSEEHIFQHIEQVRDLYFFRMTTCFSWKYSVCSSSWCLSSSSTSKNFWLQGGQLNFVTFLYLMSPLCFRILLLDRSSWFLCEFLKWTIRPCWSVNRRSQYVQQYWFRKYYRVVFWKCRFLGGWYVFWSKIGHFRPFFGQKGDFWLFLGAFRVI